MTKVYVHPSALLLGAAESGPPGTSPGPARIDPGAADAIDRLVDAGFEVAVVSGDAAALPQELAALPSVADLPEPLAADAWFLTGDPTPGGQRPRGGTTVLVGPRQPEGPVPLPRFDLTSRDLSAAVMEIMTREALA